MDMYGGTLPAHYQQPPIWPSQEDELWVDSQVTPRLFLDRTGTLPLQRYLHDADHPWFTPQSPDDYKFDFPLQAVYADPSVYCMPGQQQYVYNAPQRCTSPCTSGPSPSSVENSWSDRQSPPWSPPTTPNDSPEMAYRDPLGFVFGGYSGVKDEKPLAGAPCVALTDVQHYADTQPEEDTYQEEPASYFAFSIQEGYQPMQVAPAQPNGILLHDNTVEHAAEHKPETPRFRRRHTHDTPSITSPHNPSKVSKRTHGKKRALSHPTKSKADKCNDHYHSSANKAFPCPFAIYGCKSTFGSKNEWKRHINTQHMRLSFWRCDLCDLGERRTNDFNRKDLFTQHVRRMHPPPQKAPKTSKAKAPNSRPSKNDPYEQELIAIANRCFHHTRSSPEDSGCLFCAERFTGTGSWDERLEHIGKHMENAKKETFEPMDPPYWREDPELEEWLADEKIIVGSEEGYVLADGQSG